MSARQVSGTVSTLKTSRQVIRTDSDYFIGPADDIVVVTQPGITLTLEPNARTGEEHIVSSDGVIVMVVGATLVGSPLVVGVDESVLLSFDGFQWTFVLGGVPSNWIQEHPKLRQLVHLAEGQGGPWEGFVSGSYRETLPFGAAFPTLIRWWTADPNLFPLSAKLIVTKLITFNAQKLVTQLQWTVYDVDGVTALAQVTDVISYSTVFETSRTRTVI